ncbi:hypothetical protein TVAG_359690 [Trichomonas vaginalis G3]|uniref:Uncharacterized protein n=1 Tax=Trichomonas vaginalis (strain ATCC PRA-98 / G3) TaxID=412133 RepID=A2DT88_TRIV3|nr:hypothetical protein TVAGG3_0968360 [Trichomonas vaginalis G3]EAY16360.1 hypothetical protein TVAG_359690 [Trichomonas vaginalis G3]KAI5488410.1 hypothetical protein TVAGG3_0968360 [Trichomonas vaginalis G3]|eukprot:XP_001328583.1 hypothetical protein [Trichomonas vaginalis G3]
MGILLSCCQGRSQYQPLDEGEDQIAAIERTKLQALEDDDNELLKDPTIQEVLQDSGSDQEQMNDEDVAKYIQGLGA